MIDVTNARLIGLVVNDQPFDVRHGQTSVHERLLDFRGGLLQGNVEFPAGRHRTPPR